MAIHVYACERGHLIEMEEPAAEEMTGLLCHRCKERTGRNVPLRLSPVVRTGTPILKKGIGGFYRAND